LHYNNYQFLFLLLRIFSVFVTCACSSQCMETHETHIMAGMLLLHNIIGRRAGFWPSSTVTFMLQSQAVGIALMR